MGIPADVGTGTTITFETSTFTAQVTDIGWGGIAREAIETTHMGSTVQAGEIGGREYIQPRLADPGEITLEINFDPDLVPPIMAIPEKITVTFPLAPGDVTPATWEADGFMSGYEASVPVEDKMSGTATIKITGPITITPSSAT